MPATLRTFALVFVVLVASGCAAAPGRTRGEDPYEGFNRGVYKFNDVVDRAALKPVAKGYKKITPRWLRIGIGNFFSNVEYPTTIVNQFLQGKGKQGLRDTGRFLLNTTFGVLGLWDVGTAVGLEKNDEDFGQTLAVWGVGSGPFLNLPMFGPSTLRDAPARVFSFFLDPVSYTEISWQAEWSRRLLEVVHTRAELLSLDPTLQRTYDPYAFIRDAWVQQREFEIFDGNPPPETLEDLGIEEEDAAALDEAAVGDEPAEDEPPAN